MYIILGILAFLIVILIFMYNNMISLNIRCNNAWANIDNQLKRRADLIPNLVNITKGYAKYESETLEKLVALRSDNISDKAKNSEEISNAVTNLLAVAENYPDLKANTIYSNLQIELVGTEDKIAYARQFYNDTVQKFNTTIQKFPNNIFASIMHFNEREYFKVSDEDKKRVDIKL